MTIMDALKDLRSYLKGLVKELDIKLQQEGAETFVEPYVEICYFPHKNFTPGGFQVPGILISMDRDEDNANDQQLDVRLICSTYGGGYYPESQIPDAKGYEDLINMMERIKIELVNQRTIGRCTINKPVEIGIYDTVLSWPYWYGYMEFSVQIPATEFVLDREREEFLHGDL